MSKTWEAVHPEVRWYIEDVARQVRRRRWMGAARRFGWIMFALTALFTLTLWFTAASGVAGIAIAAGYFAALGAGALLCALPVLRRAVSLEQVALFIDERHPELESRISTALDLATHDRDGVSAWLTEKFLEESLERFRATPLADLLDPAPARTLGFNAATMLVASLIFFFAFSSAWLPTLSLLRPGSGAKVASLPFSVEPGDVRVRRGDNQMIWVRTTDADREVIVRWRVPGAEWQELAANPSSTERVYYHEFANVQQDLQYQVRYGRQRSKEFQITAWLPPDVTGIDLTYHYPEYLGQPSREVPNSGNITAVEGTNVDVDVWTNKPVAKADLVLESGARVALVRKDKTRWQIPVTVTKDDAYHIELADEDGEANEYPSRYTIAMHRDRAPEVKIDFPRGDNEVTVLEEVPFDFSVSDDYGFASYGVQYEVAGHDPVRVTLGQKGAPQTAAQGHHELQLENLGLEVGDFITWTIWAEDSRPGRSQYETMGDPFFLEVRPFKREYREALSGAGGAQGAGEQEDDPEKIQKNILIASWNLRRESRYMDESEFKEKRGTIVDTQEKLAQSLAGQDGPMQAPDSEMLRLREEMKGSVEALNRAALPDPKAPLSEATAHQQAALRLMARMKPRNAQVQQTQGGGGGGGGGERGDISELEMARNRNFYEQENVTREQQKATDEVLNRIKELAQRQQNVNDEIAKLISELQTAKTDEERERLKKQLEKLRDEMRTNLERLDQANQNLNSNALPNEQTRNAQEALDRARHQMNRSLEQMDRNELQQAQSAGARASEALEDMQERLQQFGREAAGQRMLELQKQMRDLQDQQRQLVANAEQAQQLHQSPSMDDQKKLEETQKQLGEGKDKLAEDFKAMMDEASELASRGGQTQELMTRRLGDWMRETSKEGIYEDIQETKPLIQYGIWDSALAEEKKISDKLAKAGEKLDAVAGSLVGDDLEAMQKALENLDKLMQREEVARALEDKNADQAKPGPGAPQDAEKSQEQGAGPGKPGEDQKQPGDGTQPGKDQQQPGTAQGQQPSTGKEGASQQQAGGQQPGSQDGQPSPGQPQADSQDTQPSSSPQQGGPQRGAPQRMAGRPQGGADRGGAQTGATGGPFDPERAMRDFAESGYQEWIENLRDAESLLPEGTPLRTDVIRLRERVEAMRRDWRARSLAPRFDLFLEMAARPLADTTEHLHREIERLLNQKEFLAQDEGEVPERYREPVAEYFKRLSESEGLK
jgi:hypothetical protein